MNSNEGSQESWEQNIRKSIENLPNSQEQLNYIVSYLKRIIASALSIQPEKLELDEALTTYGVDEVVSKDLRNTLARDLSFFLSVTIFRDYSTLRNLSEYLLKLIESELDK